MSTFSRSTPGALLLSILIGILAMAATLVIAISLAHGQTVVPEVAYLPPFVYPDLDTILTRGAIASVLVSTGMLFLRGAFPRLTNGTDASRLGNYTLAILLGLVTGFAGVAPQLSPGLGGWLLGGFLAGGLACFGRDAIVTGVRAVQRQKGAASGAVLDVDPATPEVPAVPPAAP